MDKLKHFYVGVKGVIINSSTKKALVLVRVDQSGERFWDLPGGRINTDERILDTLKRELKEEIPNINKFQIKKLLHAYRLSNDLSDGLGLMLLFYKVESDIIDVELSQEHNGFRWVDIYEINNLNSNDIYIEDGYLKALELALK